METHLFELIDVLNAHADMPESALMAEEIQQAYWSMSIFNSSVRYENTAGEMVIRYSVSLDDLNLIGAALGRKIHEPCHALPYSWLRVRFVSLPLLAVDFQTTQSI